MTPIPGYIERRFRRPVPADSYVVPGSTPVISFGDARNAKVATLGLNPSHLEFLDHSGRELTGTLRRLATHQSLGTVNLSDAPASLIAQALDDCREYFNRRAYGWFDQLEPIVNACRRSYYDRSACHLDLVQWATKPAWGKLKPASLRRRLLDDDAAFLVEQLQNENIETLARQRDGGLA